MHVSHRSMAQGMQGIEAIEPRLDLPGSERMLQSTLGDALPALVAKDAVSEGMTQIDVPENSEFTMVLF